MFDRIRLAAKVLFCRKIIVVTKGETFTTFNNATVIDANGLKRVEVKE